MPSLSGKKRSLDGSAQIPKAKKSKLDNSSKKPKTSKEEKAPQPPSTVLAEDVDFPRGGGTSFTALEVKAIRAEAVKEANDELFQVRNTPIILDLLRSLLVRTRKKSQLKGPNERRITRTETRKRSRRRETPYGLNI